jgi:chromosome partitioning protein
VEDRYDLVLIDCPPGMTPLTMNALVASSHVLVPTPLDYLSVAGLAMLTETVEEVREYDNPELRYLGIVGTQVDQRTRHTREVRAQLEELFGAHAGGTLCRTTIRHTTRVRDAHVAHLAVGQLYPEHPVSQDYRNLAAELIFRARLTTPLQVTR